MNVIGIEQQSTYSVLALREAAHRARLVGDGRRPVIPAAVWGDLWGSDAAANPNSRWDGWSAATDLTGFWRGLHDRLARFTGGLTIGAHDFRTVVATTLPEAEIVELALTAGFTTPRVISPPQAALAAWLSRQRKAAASELVVAAVAIGDLSADAAAFAVRVGPSPAILQMESTPPLGESGVSYWTRQLIRQVADHLPAAGVGATNVEIWQAALEMGDRLRRAAPRATVCWCGPWEDQLLAPVGFSVAEFLHWDEVENLTRWLPQVAARLVAKLGPQRPDVLLLSGLGAGWPISPDAWEELPRPIIPADPAGDIAWGASFWPMLGESRTDLYPPAGLGSRRTTAYIAPQIRPGLAAPTTDQRRGLASEDSMTRQGSLGPPGLQRDEFARLLGEQLNEFPSDEP